MRLSDQGDVNSFFSVLPSGIPPSVNETRAAPGPVGRARGPSLVPVDDAPTVQVLEGRHHLGRVKSGAPLISPARF